MRISSGAMFVFRSVKNRKLLPQPNGLFGATRLTLRSCSGPPFGRSSPLHGVVTAARKTNALHVSTDCELPKNYSCIG